MRINGYSKLTEEQKNLFNRVHKAHMKMFGLEMQRKYAIENIKEIKWNKKENCIEVYYVDNWCHYDQRGHWY